jgi:myo-inositol-1(or 4)-monophosphatase
MTPTDDFLHQAEKVIRHTLDKLRPQLLEAQGNIEHKLKGDATVVTEMDLLVEHKLRDALAAFDQGIGFGGEETGADFDQETFWLADPIDGTAPFIRGLPFATNMIALMHKGEPIMSIINNIAMGEYFLAIKGQGATCNGHPIHVSNRPLNQAWVLLGSSVEQPSTQGLNDLLATKVKAVRRFGGAGFEYSSIARGAMEARISYLGHGHEWDYAPGALMVQEAGGRVLNIGSDSYNYRNFNHIVANPVIFDELMQFMTSFIAKQKTNL